MLWDLLQVGIAKDRKTDWDKISIFPQISFLHYIPNLGKYSMSLPLFFPSHAFQN